MEFFVKCKNYIINKYNNAKQHIKSMNEWNNAKNWAEVFHPAWLYLATQEKRTELKETYRNKILYEYRVEQLNRR